MAGNTIYMQEGSNYIDIHDNEVVNLSVDKGTVTMSDGRCQMEDVDNENSNENTEPVAEELNYFAPTNSLRMLLKQPWFSDARSDEMYTAEWTDAFVEALMGSEYGEEIAREWNNGGKLDRCSQIKGYLLGLLKDAGVLKGSYDAIAEKVNLTDKPRTFSRYMSDGKLQPYALWVKEYIKGKDI